MENVVHIKLKIRTKSKQFQENKILVDQPRANKQILNYLKIVENKDMHVYY